MTLIIFSNSKRQADVCAVPCASSVGAALEAAGLLEVAPPLPLPLPLPRPWPEPLPLVRAAALGG